MSTRGTITLTVDRTSKHLYSHSNSYPSGLGKNIVEFLYTASLDLLADDIRRLTPVSDDTPPTPAQQKMLAPFHENVSTGNDWYAWLRGTQGDLSKTLLVGLYEEYGPQAEEWDYTIDMDARTFSVEGESYDPETDDYTSLLRTIPLNELYNLYTEPAMAELFELKELAQP